MERAARTPALMIQNASSAVVATIHPGFSAAFKDAIDKAKLMTAKQGWVIGGSSRGGGRGGGDGGATAAAASAAAAAASTAATGADIANAGVASDGDFSPTCSMSAASLPSSSAVMTPLGSSRNLSGHTAAAAAGGAGGERLRMVVVVRDDLLQEWGQAKTAVMIADSFLQHYKKCSRSRSLRPMLASWEAGKGAKNVLRAADEPAVSRLMDGARAANIPAHALLGVVGNGNDNDAPSRTRLIVAVGPATREALLVAGCAGLPAY